MQIESWTTQSTPSEHHAASNFVLCARDELWDSVTKQAPTPTQVPPPSCMDVRAKGFVSAIIKLKMTTSLRGFDALK
jgi:hypothetical protein